ncbi:MAG TPA: sulfatase-like hydrolase/transferase, partial [Candidatus Binataceae bacterium]|nr:sulfatase-like hydrolase/transferase [Candidatus Binataceae bacterium]
EFYLAATCVLIGCATIVWRAAHLTARMDLVLGLLLGGYGPMPGPPAYDSSLPTRGQNRAANPTRRANVIVLVVDSLRARNMSAYGYGRRTTPFLDTLLAQRGARAIPLAVTNCPSTEAALWTLFSSRRSRHHAVNAPCLHDVLRAAGNSSRFLLSGCHRHWMGLDALYGTDHDGFIDLLTDRQLVLESAKLPMHSSKRGSFIFLHLMSAHAAEAGEPIRTWTPARNRFSYDESATLDAIDREQMRNHYDNSILMADGTIARLMETLGAKGFLDDAIVVITSDHGEALADRMPVMIGHGRGLYQEGIQVPLIFWDSTRALPQPNPIADQTDIAPTLLAMLGIAAPAPWQGMSVWSTVARRHTHVEHVAHRVSQPPIHMEAVIAARGSETYKAMQYRQAGRAILRRTFCLSSDADETRDLTGRLSDDIEVQLENIFRDYHAQPALAFATSWKYLERHQNHGTAAEASRDTLMSQAELV